MTILIIGGGLSGLALANRLDDHGQEFKLLEARSRFGGRIKTQKHGDASFDLGPAWFWPGQPRIAKLIQRFGLKPFKQFSEGATLFENQHGAVQHYLGQNAMQNSWRIEGGMTALIDALVAGLPEENLQLNAVVTKIEKADDIISVFLKNGQQFTADKVVLALPPRLAADLSYMPPLPKELVDTLRNIPTWMAGQAKAIAIYENAFWRDRDLSGDMMSHRGPMVEIHDASPVNHGPCALFGFLGVPPEARHDHELLLQSVRNQFSRLLGPDAREPIDLFLKDWAFDPLTATNLDHAPLFAHPTYGLSQVMQNIWANTLYLSGTETAPQFGGFLEGALEAAENTFKQLTR